MAKTRVFKAISITVAVVLIALIGMFATDAYCAGHLAEPIFAKPVPVVTGTGHILTGIEYGLYKGIGYTVETQTYTAEDSDIRLVAVTMYLGDRVVSASIT